MQNLLSTIRLFSQSSFKTPIITNQLSFQSKISFQQTTRQFHSSSLLLAVPKHKVSISRRKRRWNSQALRPKTAYKICKGCGNPVRLHHICIKCKVDPTPIKLPNIDLLMKAREIAEKNTAKKVAHLQQRLARPIESFNTRFIQRPKPLFLDEVKDLSQLTLTEKKKEKSFREKAVINQKAKKAAREFIRTRGLPKAKSGKQATPGKPNPQKATGDKPQTETKAPEGKPKAPEGKTAAKPEAKPKTEVKAEGKPKTPEGKAAPAKPTNEKPKNTPKK